MNHVLVTGATGFIGQHLVKALRAAGDDVSCMVRRPADHLEQLGCRLWKGDVSNADALHRAVAAARPGVVFHLAGVTKATAWRQYFEVNEQGCANLLEAARRQSNPPVVLLVSSLAAAGPSDPNRARRESDKPRPVSFYGKSKLAAERVALGFCRDVPVTVVRPPIVLGPGDKGGLEMFKTIAHFGVHMVPGLSEMHVSWIDVHDLVRALPLVAARGKRLGEEGSAEGTYYCTSAETACYAHLGNKVASALGRDSVRVIRNPRWLVWTIAGVNEMGGRVTGRPHVLGLDKAREATAGSWTCDGRKLREETGFACRVSLQESLTVTANWYREQGWL